MKKSNYYKLDVSTIQSTNQLIFYIISYSLYKKYQDELINLTKEDLGFEIPTSYFEDLNLDYFIEKVKLFIAISGDNTYEIYAYKDLTNLNSCIRIPCLNVKEKDCTILSFNINIFFTKNYHFYIIKKVNGTRNNVFPILTRTYYLVYYFNDKYFDKINLGNNLLLKKEVISNSSFLSFNYSFSYEIKLTLTKYYNLKQTLLYFLNNEQSILTNYDMFIKKINSTTYFLIDQYMQIIKYTFSKNYIFIGTDKSILKERIDNTISIENNKYRLSFAIFPNNIFYLISVYTFANQSNVIINRFLNGKISSIEEVNNPNNQVNFVYEDNVLKTICSKYKMCTIDNNSYSFYTKDKDPSIIRKFKDISITNVNDTIQVKDSDGYHFIINNDFTRIDELEYLTSNKASLLYEITYEKYAIIIEKNTQKKYILLNNHGYINSIYDNDDYEYISKDWHNSRCNFSFIKGKSQIVPKEKYQLQYENTIKEGSYYLTLKYQAKIKIKGQFKKNEMYSICFSLKANDNCKIFTSIIINGIKSDNYQTIMVSNNERILYIPYKYLSDQKEIECILLSSNSNFLFKVLSINYEVAMSITNYYYNNDKIEYEIIDSSFKKVINYYDDKQNIIKKILENEKNSTYCILDYFYDKNSLIINNSGTIKLKNDNKSYQISKPYCDKYFYDNDKNLTCFINGKTNIATDFVYFSDNFQFNEIITNLNDNRMYIKEHNKATSLSYKLSLYTLTSLINKTLHENKNHLYTYSFENKGLISKIEGKNILNFFIIYFPYNFSNNEGKVEIKINDDTISYLYTYDSSNLKQLNSIDYNFGKIKYIYDVFKRINSIVNIDMDIKYKFYYHQYSLTKNITTDYIKTLNIYKNKKLLFKINYSYDFIGKIIKIITPINKTIYKYDFDDLVINEFNSFYNERIEYKYDFQGNLLVVSSKKKRREYHYDNFLRLIEMNDLNNNYLIKIIKYNLDDTINCFKINNKIFHLTYQKKLLSSINDTTFSYDEFNNIILKQEQKKYTKYYYENYKLQKEMAFNAQKELYEITYFYDKNGIYSFIYKNKQYFYIKDINNSIIGIFNEKGIILAYYIYDYFGNHIVLDENMQENNKDNFIGNINPFRFKSYYFFKNNNLYYFNNCFYNSLLNIYINKPKNEDYTIIDEGNSSYC